MIRRFARTLTAPRATLSLAAVLFALAGTPLASAHGGAAYFPRIHQWYALVPLVVGLAVVGGAVLVRRSDYAVSVDRLLGVTFLGLVVAALGAVSLVQLSPITSVTASTRPFDSHTLTLLRLVLGVAIAGGGFVLGRLGWQDRPRYTFFGILLGGWLAYPAVLANDVPSLNPLGYLLFATTLAAIGYIAWRDCRHAIAALAADRVSARFGLGTGVLAAFFFMFSAGILIVLPDPNGVGLSWTHSTVAITRVQDPLVYWPSVEFWFPSLPLGGYLSVGMVSLVGTLAALVGLNGAVVAYQWRCRAGAGFDGAAGAAAIAAPNACCCCGPVLSQLVVVALGPTAAMPFYWLFIDVSSPFGVLFFAGSLALLLGNLVRFAGAFDPALTPSASNSGPASDSA